MLRRAKTVLAFIPLLKRTGTDLGETTKREIRRKLVSIKVRITHHHFQNLLWLRWFVSLEEVLEIFFGKDALLLFFLGGGFLLVRLLLGFGLDRGGGDDAGRSPLPNRIHRIQTTSLVRRPVLLLTDHLGRKGKGKEYCKGILVSETYNFKQSDEQTKTKILTELERDKSVSQ